MAGHVGTVDHTEIADLIVLADDDIKPAASLVSFQLLWSIT